jgi:hypothetical protein
MATCLTGWAAGHLDTSIFERARFDSYHVRLPWVCVGAIMVLGTLAATVGGGRRVRS